MFRVLKAIAYGGSANFTPLEKTLLSSLQEKLGSEAGGLLQKQIGETDLIQRHSDSREVRCYATGKRDPLLSFPASAAELKLATIDFTIPGETGRWRADFYLVNGHLSSFEFTPSPKVIRNRKDIQIQQFEIHQDPMKRTLDVKSRPAKEGTLQLQGWLRDWSEKYQLHDLYEPLGEDERDQRINSISAELPQDYLELTRQCEGFVVNRCVVFGLSQVYDVVLPNWNYYLLAEIDGEGALAIKAHSSDGLIYYLDYGGASPAEISRSFKDALEAMLARPPQGS